MPNEPDRDSEDNLPLDEKEIFLRALEIREPDKRAAWLLDACGADLDLHTNVKLLLAAAQDDGALEPDRDLLASGLQEMAASDDGLISSLGTSISYFGDYELLSEVARGAMGVVFRARQSSLSRIVAVKMIRGSLFSSKSDILRFKAESEAAASLDHPNIVPIYEVGEHESQHYFSMKYIEGGTLADHLTKFSNDPRAAASLLKTVARAIHYAHQHGILHRDLKPGNILIDGENTPHISDFGLAKQIGNESGLTLSGQIMGSPLYMAPEQAAGETNNLTTAADIYSLGAILYELLSGQPPFQGDTILETLRKAREEEAPRLSTISAVDRDLETITTKCLEKNPAARYSTANDLADDLENWLEGRPINARPITSVERTIKWVKRKPVVATLWAVAALFIFTLGIGGPIVAFQQKALTEQARLSENAAIDSEYKAIRALQIAEDRAKTIRQNLYVAEMNLAGNASADGGGLAEVLLITDRWQSRSQPEDFRGWEWYYLRATTARELSQHIHPGYVGEYKFSPNGNRVANVSLDNRIRIWPSDFSSDPLKIGPFSVHLRSIAWDSSGGIVVCGGVEGFLKSFDAVTGKELLDYKDAKNFELNKSVVRSNHGDRFASASKNKVTIWNWKSPKPIDSHHIKEIGTIDAFAWSQDDRAIVLASPRKILRLNVETGIVDWQTSATKGMRFERTLSLNFDSTLIAVAGTDQKVHILDAESGEYLHHLSGHNGSIPMVAWSPEGRLLASASGYSIRLWDPDEAFSSRVLGEHLHSVERIAWSPDGNRIISSDEQHRIKIWPIYKQANLRTIKVSNQWVSDLCWNPEGTRLASATITGNVSIWDFESGEHLRTMIEDRDRVMSVNWSTDGKWLTSTGWSGGVNLWNMENDLAHPKLQGLAGRGLDCEISADGKTILGRAWDNMVLWEREAGKIRFSVPLPNVSNSGTSASLSPDSSLIATADSRSIGIWETETGRKIQRIPYDGQSPKTTIFKGVSWHPNGKIILAAAKDNIARIWDVNSGELLQTLSGHGGWVTAGVWNPDGSRVATASYDGTCRIWNPVTGDLLLTLITGHGVVQAVRWHPDGRSLATCGTDGTIKIWDARKGYEMKEAKE